MKIRRYIALFLSYLTLSPLLLLFDGKWQILPKWLRITLFVLSPCTLIVTLIVAGLIELAIYSYIHEYRFTTNRAMKEFTGTCFPPYSITSFKYGGSLANCHYYTLKFTDTPTALFYRRLENKAEECDIDNGGKMYFSMDYSYPCFVSYLGAKGFVKHGIVILEIEKDNPVFEIKLIEFPK